MLTARGGSTESRNSNSTAYSKRTKFSGSTPGAGGGNTVTFLILPNYANHFDKTTSEILALLKEYKLEISKNRK